MMTEINKTKDGTVTLFLVDDDAVFLKSLEIEFLQYPVFKILTFSTGELCVEHLKIETPDFVILDYHLDGINPTAMNGIATLDAIKAFNKDTAVIMLSSQDKIEVAIDCMHHLATDYVIKSETAFIRLQKIITNVFSLKKIEKTLDWYMTRV